MIDGLRRCGALRDVPLMDEREPAGGPLRRERSLLVREHAIGAVRGRGFELAEARGGLGEVSRRELRPCFVVTKLPLVRCRREKLAPVALRRWRYFAVGSAIESGRCSRCSRF